MVWLILGSSMKIKGVELLRELNHVIQIRINYKLLLIF